MARPAKAVVCTDEEIEYLQHITNGMKTEKRFVDRARIILACADGMEVQKVAKACGRNSVTVIK